MERIARARLVGVDRDMDRLRQAWRSATGAQVCRADVLRLPFRDDSFHKVLMSEVLEHLLDEDGGIAEVRRVMKSGGILAVSVPHVDQPFLWDPIYRLWSAAGGRPLRTSSIATIWSGHYRLYRPEDLVRCLEKGGFAVERVEEATHYCFPFAHFLVYGIGKPLIEKGILPESSLKWCHRMRSEENRMSGINLFDMLRRLFRAIDSFNDRKSVKGKRTFVNVLARARKMT
jgi:SAM-dependent methyltransferase